MNAKELGAQFVSFIPGSTDYFVHADRTETVVNRGFGLTKRELFAAMFGAALVALIKNADEDIPVLPSSAVGLADELLAELSKDRP